MKNNEVSETETSKDESKKSEKATGSAKGPGLFKRLSSAMLLQNLDCSSATSQESKIDNEKNEVSETSSKDESKKPKGQGYFRRNSSVMFICYTLSFKNGSKIATDKK